MSTAPMARPEGTIRWSSRRPRRGHVQQDRDQAGQDGHRQERDRDGEARTARLCWMTRVRPKKTTASSAIITMPSIENGARSLKSTKR